MLAITPRRFLLPLLLALALTVGALPLNAAVAQRLGVWLVDSDGPVLDGSAQLSQQDWLDFDELDLMASAGSEDIDTPPERAMLDAFDPARGMAVFPAFLPAAVQGPRFPTGPPERA